MEINIVNPHMLSILDKTRDLFLERRELCEETSITSIEIIKELNEWLTYYLPKNLVGKIWKGKYRGQKQKWFIVKFIGKEEEINKNTKHPEFIE